MSILLIIPLLIIWIEISSGNFPTTSWQSVQSGLSNFLVLRGHTLRGLHQVSCRSLCHTAPPPLLLHSPVWASPQLLHWVPPTVALKPFSSLLHHIGTSPHPPAAMHASPTAAPCKHSLPSHMALILPPPTYSGPDSPSAPVLHHMVLPSGVGVGNCSQRKACKPADSSCYLKCARLRFS